MSEINASTSVGNRHVIPKHVRMRTRKERKGKERDRLGGSPRVSSGRAGPLLSRLALTSGFGFEKVYAETPEGRPCSNDGVYVCFVVYLNKSTRNLNGI